MKRVRICSLAVCLVLTLAVLMPVASADNYGPGSTIAVFCTVCNTTRLFSISSYRQPTSTSSGYVNASCQTCFNLISRSTHYWGSNFSESYTSLGFFDVIPVRCLLTGQSELSLIASLNSVPTCTSGGSIYVVHLGSCSAGGNLFLSALGHSWTETSRNLATCLTSGTAQYKCSRCNETKTETISQSLGHSMKESSRTPATCTASGSIVNACIRCSYTQTETLPKIPHSWKETRTEPTCTSHGSLVSACSACGTKQSETAIPALDHDMKETSRTPATCTAPGSIVRSCSRCDYTETETIPVIDHAWTEERTEPTCISPGSIVSTCSACGLQKTEELPMLGGTHDWVESSRMDATCAAPGSITYTCSRCQDTKTEPIPQSDQHAWEVAETVPASYDSSGRLVSQGYVLYRCPVCGETYTTAIGTSPPGYTPIPEGSGGEGMADTTAALGKTFLSAVWRLFGLYVPGFSFTFGQMWVGFFLASVSILVIKLIFGFGRGSCPGDTPRTSSTTHAKISKERRNDEF